MLCGIAFAACGEATDPDARDATAGAVRDDRVEPVAAHPHDPDAFTQGLAFHDGHLYEGTGLRGRSSLRKVAVATGRVVERIDLSRELFGEGVALYDGRIYQLTWKAGVGLVYGLEDLEPRRRFEYEGEGWGLASDGDVLAMSDGSATLRFLDPDSLRVVRRLRVHDEGSPVVNLNELEFIRGEIYANVAWTDEIVRIDPETGRVAGRIHLGQLAAEERRGDPEAILNGIAFDPKNDRVFVTGKRWRRVYEFALEDLE